MICKKCNKDIEENANYCNYCGQSVLNEENSMNNTIEKITTTQKNYNKINKVIEDNHISKRKICISILCCITIAIGVLMLNLSKSPEKVIKNYCSYLAKGNFEKAMDLIDKKTMPQEMLEELQVMQIFFAYQEVRNSLKTFELEDVEIISKKGSTCIAEVTCSLGEGINYEILTEKIALSKVDRKWKLDLILTERLNEQ